jgi:uncharacterized membrane protein YeaQ/YmgE (transglycosylase-associated protein family)
MFHFIWYVLVGVIAKSVMHAHITLFWTIALGIIGSILGGAITHIFSRPPMRCSANSGQPSAISARHFNSPS